MAQGAVPLDGTTRQYLEGRPYAPVPDPEVFRALWRRAEALGYPHRVGLVASEDAFYATTPEEARAWARYGVLAFEMEASALFLLGRMRGVRTGAILAVSNRIGDPELAPLRCSKRAFGVWWRWPSGRPGGLNYGARARTRVRPGDPGV